MKQANYSDFILACERSNIQLHDALRGCNQYPGSCFSPGEWYDAIANAGETLRLEPEAELASAALSDDLLDANDGIAQGALKGIVNSSIDRVGIDEIPAGRSFICDGANRVPNCSDAERLFSGLLSQMAWHSSPIKIPNRAPIMSRWGIVTDDTNSPIGITKFNGERSTLSLEEISVNGVVYPPGSLFRMDTLRHKRRGEIGHSIIPSNRISHAAFMRLSGFAIGPEDRRRDFDIDNTRPNYNSLTIMKIKKIAKRAMRHSVEID